MKPAPLQYVRPAALEEALQILAERGDEAKPIAGGQSLMPLLNLRLARTDLLVDIMRLPGLSDIDAGPDGALRLGALVRHRDLIGSPEIDTHAPLLAQCAPLIGHPAIRNRGTVGGSVAHADPAAELPAALLALDATVHLRSTQGERHLPARDFFQGIFLTAARPDELVTAVSLPAPLPYTGWAFLEFARRHGDFALVSAAARVTLDRHGRCLEARLVFAGITGAPGRAQGGEALLAGQTLATDLIAEAARLGAAPLEMPDDMHASAGYRREVARVLAERALTAAWRQSHREEMA